MSALSELQAGAAGAAFITELQRTIRAVGVARNFPPPEGHRQWDADAVAATASEFMTDSQTARRLTDLALHCASDQALRARLQGTVRHPDADDEGFHAVKLRVRRERTVSVPSRFVDQYARIARTPRDTGCRSDVGGRR